MSSLIIILLITAFHGCIQTDHGVKSSSNEQVYIDSADYDFGIVPDSVTVLKRNFILHNQSLDTCRIERVIKSCGCTSVLCAQNLILPGDSTEIQIEVRMGDNYNFFEKDVNVYTSLSEIPLTIYIRAIRKMPPHVVAQFFPFKVSDYLRISADYLVIGYVEHGKVVNRSFNIINTSSKEVELKADLSQLPSYMSVIYPQKLPQESIARIVVTYDMSQDSTHWGETRNFFYLYEEGTPKYLIKAISVFTENFQSHSTDYPRIFMPVTYFTLTDEDLRSENVEKTFKIKNFGKSDLIIRNVQINSGQDVSYELSNHVIHPESSEEISVKVSLKSLLEENIEIGLTTNDRMEPYKLLKISGRGRNLSVR